MTPAEKCLFGGLDGFFMLDRWLLSEVRRVDLGSHTIPLVMHREHEGSYVVSAQELGLYKMCLGTYSFVTLGLRLSACHARYRSFRWHSSIWVVLNCLRSKVIRQVSWSMDGRLIHCDRMFGLTSDVNQCVLCQAGRRTTVS